MRFRRGKNDRRSATHQKRPCRRLRPLLKAQPISPPPPVISQLPKPPPPKPPPGDAWWDIRFNLLASSKTETSSTSRDTTPKAASSKPSPARLMMYLPDKVKSPASSQAKTPSPRSTSSPGVVIAAGTCPLAISPKPRNSPCKTASARELILSSSSNSHPQLDRHKIPRYS
jgi:hypothetical protein